MALFIGRLNGRIHKQDLEERFEKFGRLTRCDLKPQGYAFITFEDVRDAEDAMRDMQGIEVNGCKINIEWSKESGRYHKNTFFRSPPPKGDRNRMERFEKVEKNRKHRKYASRSRSFSNSRSRSRESYVYRRRQRFHTRSRSPTPVNHNRRQHRREANDRRRKRQRSRSQSRSRWRSYSARYSQEKGDFGRDRDRRTFRSKANNYSNGMRQ